MQHDPISMKFNSWPWMILRLRTSAHYQGEFFISTALPILFTNYLGIISTLIFNKCIENDVNAEYSANCEI